MSDLVLVPSPRETLLAWLRRGEPFAIASVAWLSGSAPRGVGASLLISADGSRFVGSVSAGCLENELIAEVPGLLAAGRTRFFSFGPEGIQPWREGLACGGHLRVRMDPWFPQPKSRPAQRALAQALESWLAEGLGFAWLSRGQAQAALSAEGPVVGDAEAFAPEECAEARRRLLAGAASYGVAPLPAPSAGGPFSEPGCAEAVPSTTAPGGSVAERALLVRFFHRPPRLLLVGAVDTASYLCAFARNAGFEVLIQDPRAHYLSAERFPVPPQALIHGWPTDFGALQLGRRDAALVLTHDPKIDDVALGALLRTDLGYLGVLGSRQSHQARLRRLREAGETETSLARIEGPAGLKLGSSDPVGIALGMLAGVVKAQVERGQWT